MSGRINDDNCGRNFNFALKPLNFSSCTAGCVSHSVEHSFDSIAEISVILLLLLLCVCCCGALSNSQNVAACITGIISMIRNVSEGESPSAMRPAQLNEPIIPADPVPDAHAVNTFLEY